MSVDAESSPALHGARVRTGRLPALQATAAGETTAARADTDIAAPSGGLSARQAAAAAVPDINRALPAAATTDKRDVAVPDRGGPVVESSQPLPSAVEPGSRTFFAAGQSDQRGIALPGASTAGTSTAVAMRGACAGQ